MSKIKFEGNIGGYSFMMNSSDDSSIEVWMDSSGEYPDNYIRVKPGSIQNQKQFEQEISYWYMENVG